MLTQKLLRRDWLTTVAFCGAAMTSMPTAAFAQTASAQTDSVDATAPAAADEIVVTARGRAEKLQDVPVSASVLNVQDTERAGTSLVNITTLVPSLRISRSGAGTGGSISIRGIASSISNGALEQKVALNLDGVQVVRARFITAGRVDTGGIEVVKGPQ